MVGYEEVPGSLKLVLQECPNCGVLEAVVDGPENTQVLVLLDQAQDGPEALGQDEGILPTALLPGEDSQQLQGIVWGHFLLRLLWAHLSEDRAAGGLRG